MGFFSKNNSALTESAILDALRSVIDPDLHKDVVSLGMIKNVAIDGEKVTFTFELTTPSCPLKDQLELEARTAVEKIAGVGNVKVTMTANVAMQQGVNRPTALAGVRNTIAVASGKGGVGKSTVAANLAVALAKDGAKVGLLDADIYGPSIPLMFGLQYEKPEAQQVNGHAMMVPLEAHGVKVMSIGFLVDPNTAVVWRGPMAAGALKQFMTDVLWGDLDYLI
ncbi:MAG: P-loop NTPase, partial [bacterium]